MGLRSPNEFCSNCERRREGPFCTGCGHRFEETDNPEQRRFLPYLLVLGGLVAAAAIVGGAVLATRGSPGHRVATQTATPAAATISTPAQPTRAAHKRPRRKNNLPAPVAPSPLIPYTATYFSVDRPSDWSVEHDDEEQPGGFTRSQWRDPADPNTSVLIDAQEEDKTASEKASEVRAATAQTAGFRDISTTDTTMDGVPAIRWEFEVSGDHRVDYFVHNERCGVSAALLGSTSPASWTTRRETFSKVADSLALDCSAADPTSSADSGCDPNYEGACLNPDSPDYDCAGGSGDGPDYTGEVRVVGDDHFGLDRDGDGIACG